MNNPYVAAEEPLVRAKNILSVSLTAVLNEDHQMFPDDIAGVIGAALEELKKVEANLKEFDIDQ